MNNKRIILATISVSSLILGTLLYLFLNKEAYVSKLILTIVSVKDINYKSNIVLKILKNYGADFLWSVSFAFVVQMILWLRKRRVILLIFCSLLGIVYELMQCSGVISGTADIVDVIVYILGSLFAIIIIQGGKLYEEK